MAVCLVTGATDGIGRVTAEALSKRGHDVVIVGRNAEKTERVAAEISRTTGNGVKGIVADLSVQAQVRNAAAQFRTRYDRLDILVNNAGAMFTKREETVDGIEMTWALNHLNYFLLTHQLLDMLIASGNHETPSRIVNVSSMVHRNAQIDFDDIHATKRYRGMNVYAQSKLANVLFTYELARWLKQADAPVITNALHPGVVATQFAANNGLAGKIGRKLMDLISISAQDGAQTSIYLATAPEVRRFNGNYFEKCQPVASSQISYSHEIAKRLWKLSEEQVGVAI